MRGDEERPVSSLRGWLSEVYFPSLVSGGEGPLGLRLGGRATVDGPLFGRSTGQEVKKRLEIVASWLTKKSARFVRGALILGSDRDVTAGELVLDPGASEVTLPVAVLAERRPERVVLLRVHHALSPLGLAGDARKGPLGAAHTSAPQPDGAPAAKLHPAVEQHIRALEEGDVAAALACFESDGFVTDGAGKTYGIKDGELRTRYELTLLGAAGPRLRGRAADDGRSCAVEMGIAGSGGTDGDALAPVFLAIYERGESGLLKSIRVYGEASEVI